MVEVCIQRGLNTAPHPPPSICLIRCKKKSVDGATLSFCLVLTIDVFDSVEITHINLREIDGALAVVGGPAAI